MIVLYKCVGRDLSVTCVTKDSNRNVKRLSETRTTWSTIPGQKIGSYNQITGRACLRLVNVAQILVYKLFIHVQIMLRLPMLCESLYQRFDCYIY